VVVPGECREGREVVVPEGVRAGGPCLGPRTLGAVASAVAGNLPRLPQHPQHGRLRWLGIEDSPAYVGEPPCNGCAERFIRTLKEQCIWSRAWRDARELAEAVAAFVELYNTCWLIERHGHRTPREAYEGWLKTKEAA